MFCGILKKNYKVMLKYFICICIYLIFSIESIDKTLLLFILKSIWDNSRISKADLQSFESNYLKVSFLTQNYINYINFIKKIVFNEKLKIYTIYITDRLRCSPKPNNFISLYSVLFYRKQIHKIEYCEINN